MIRRRPSLAPAALAAAVAAFLGTTASSAFAVGSDPVPPPASPSGVDPKYKDPAKLPDVVLGPMAVAPAAGDLKTVITFTTAGGCPWGSNTVTRIFGPKLPAGGQNVIGNNWVFDFGSPPADRMTVPMTIDLAEVIARQPSPVILDGTYRILMQCQLPEPAALLDNFGVFEAVLNIENEKYTALTTAEDLPETPTPKVGPDAYAALEAMKNAPAPPAPMIVTPTLPPAQDIDEEKTAAAAPERESSSDEVLAVAVAGGIVAAGLLPLAWTSRRRAATAGRR